MVSERRGEHYSYARKVRELRRISNRFDPDNGYDLRQLNQWSNARKAAITRAWNEVDEYLHSVHRIYRPRKRKNLQRVSQQFWGRKAPKWMNAIPVQVMDPRNPARVTVTKKGNVELTETFPSGHKYKSRTVYFDHDLLLKDSAEAARQAMLPYHDKKDLFVVMTGEHPSRFGGGKAGVLDAVAHLTLSYGADKYDANDPSSKFYGNWLAGVRHIGSGSKQDFFEYVVAKRKYRERRESKAKSEVEKMRRMRERMKREGYNEQMAQQIVRRRFRK